MEQYRVISLIVRHGGLIAAAIGLLPVLLAVAGTIVLGWPALFIVAGLIASAVIYFLMLSYVEIVHAVADALIPK